MAKNLQKILEGYQVFRRKYAEGDSSVMQYLSRDGQRPKIMVVACSDSRVDPALILQCDPGDLFVVRNVANIIPPYENDENHHGTSAALEFGIRFLKASHLIVLGHSQCGGIQALIDNNTASNQPKEIEDDFIKNWVSLINLSSYSSSSADECAQHALNQSHKNCLTFPWIKEKVDAAELTIHLWFFDIKTGKIFSYNEEQKSYIPLDS